MGESLESNVLTEWPRGTALQVLARGQGRRVCDMFNRGQRWGLNVVISAELQGRLVSKSRGFRWLHLLQVFSQSRLGTPPTALSAKIDQVPGTAPGQFSGLGPSSGNFKQVRSNMSQSRPTGGDHGASSTTDIGRFDKFWARAAEFSQARQCLHFALRQFEIDATLLRQKPTLIRLELARLRHEFRPTSPPLRYCSAQAVTTSRLQDSACSCSPVGGGCGQAAVVCREASPRGFRRSVFEPPLLRLALEPHGLGPPPQSPGRLGSPRVRPVAQRDRAAPILSIDRTCRMDARTSGACYDEHRSKLHGRRGGVRSRPEL